MNGTIDAGIEEAAAPHANMRKNARPAPDVFANSAPAEQSDLIDDGAAYSSETPNVASGDHLRDTNAGAQLFANAISQCVRN